MIIVASIKLYPQEFYDKGVPLVTSHVRRIPIQALDVRIKSLNYLNNIMATLDAKRAGAVEAGIGASPALFAGRRRRFRSSGRSRGLRAGARC